MTRPDRVLAIVSIAAVSLSLNGAAADAQVAKRLTECKPTATGFGPSQQAAEDSWRAWVANHHGADWSDFSMARNKRYDSQNLGLMTVQYVHAQPCRIMRLNILPSTPQLAPAP